MGAWLDAAAQVTGALWAQAHDAVTWVWVNASLAFISGIVYLTTLKPDALGSVIALVVGWCSGSCSPRARSGSV